MLVSAYQNSPSLAVLSGVWRDVDADGSRHRGIDIVLVDDVASFTAMPNTVLYNQGGVDER